MRRTLYCVLAIGTLGVWHSIATEGNDQPKAFRLLDSKQLTVDLKAISQDKGDFGIDYKLRLEKTLASFGTVGNDTNALRRELNLDFKSDGFIAVTTRENRVNSIISELTLAGEPVWAPYGPPFKPRSIEDIINLPDEEAIEQFRRQAYQVSSPIWVFVGVHAKHETTQDFKDYDLAFGSSLTLTTRYLNRPLDLIFSQLRWGEAAKHNRPRQLDLTFGYDRVLNLDQTANTALRAGKTEANRLLGQVEWETGIFEQQRITLAYNVHYELDAPPAIKAAGKELNHFFMLKIDLLKWQTGNTKYGVSVKYTNGELPPNYIRGQVLGGGFSVEF